jgi:cytochrome P450
MALPTATLGDTLGLFAGVVAPTVAKGPIIRRPRIVGAAERLDLDRRAVRRMQGLRDRYGPGPLLLPIPGAPRAVILSAEHVRRVLDESPDPFATDSTEKHAALAHFQPKGVLISHGGERTERRHYNEAVLEAGCPVHQFGRRFTEVVEEEGELLLQAARRAGELRWTDFASAWFCLVRRVVLGDGAREDRELTRELDQLRRAANWAMLRPIRRRLQARFFEHLREHLARAEPQSLAGAMSLVDASPGAAPAQQVPQWLFAFDAAGIATFRALALLTTHPTYLATARSEINAPNRSHAYPIPLLRAAQLESVRLWPTTPLVLRQTTRPTEWELGVMPANVGVLIYAPFFHRDDQRLPFADRFSPELWLDGKADDWPLIPFSRGPAVCPGRELVLLLSSAMLSVLLKAEKIGLAPGRKLDSRQPLPATLNNYALRFVVGA